MFSQLVTQVSAVDRFYCISITSLPQDNQSCRKDGLDSLPQMNNSLPEWKVTNRPVFIDVRYKLTKIMKYFPKFPHNCPCRKSGENFENLKKTHIL